AGRSPSARHCESRRQLAGDDDDNGTGRRDRADPHRGPALRVRAAQHRCCAASARDRFEPRRHPSDTVPGISTASGGFTSFVQEGQAIPVRQMVSSAGVTFGPRKLATIFALTREMVESSNAEALVKLVMTESLSVALDAALFSNVAGDSVRPPGLLAGITPIGAAQTAATAPNGQGKGPSVVFNSEDQ